MEVTSSAYVATKEAVVNASQVVAENVSYAAEKVKEGANYTVSAISGAAQDVKEGAS